MLNEKLQIVIFLCIFIEFIDCEDAKSCKKTDFNESLFVDEKAEFPWWANKSLNIFFLLN